MPSITKMLTVNISLEQFLDNCSNIELKELDLLIQSPRYTIRIQENKEIALKKQKPQFITTAKY